MRIRTVITRWQRVSVGVLLAGCLVLGGARASAASVVYDFSLPANGDVGAISIQLTFADVLPVDALNVFGLSGPEVTAFSSGTPIDSTSSFVGIEVTAVSTLFGIRLSPGASEVLTTVDYPADFFTFGRASEQAGTFLSATGTVFSDLVLATATPTATLVVMSAVPEPATVALLGLGALGAAVWRRRRTATA